MAEIKKGIQVQIDDRPDFSGFLIPSASQDKKFKINETIEDRNGLDVTEIMDDRQETMDATLVLAVGTDAPDIGQVLTDSADSDKGWLIRELSRPREAGMSLKYNVKLEAKEGVDLTIVQA